MGSRMMHLIISKQVQERLPILQQDHFLLGGVAPDAAFPKDRSHFYTGAHEDYSRRIAYEQFFTKYANHRLSMYMLGYYAHLISDDLWLTGFYLPWLKNRIEANEDMLKQYHQDFRLLNMKLVEHYGVSSDLIDGLLANDEMISLEEVTNDEIVAFLPALEGDFKSNDQALTEPLTVFTLEQIIGYIETATAKSLYLVKEKLSTHSFK